MFLFMNMDNSTSNKEKQQTIIQNSF